MKRVLFAFTILAAIAAASCRRQDIRTFTLEIPDMKDPACVTIVVNALMREQGIRGDDIRVDLAARTVTVRYDSLLRAQKNLVFCVVKAGFSANGVPADPEAAKSLPEACR